MDFTKDVGFLLNLGMCHFYLDLEEGDLLLCIYIYPGLPDLEKT